MLAVLSPAKKLHGVVPSGPLKTQPVLATDAARLLTRTRKLSPKKLSALMSISSTLAELNHGRFQSMTIPAADDAGSAAALTFAGDTYVGLDAGSMSEEDLAWAQDHVRILSGLYGVLRPMDQIQPYRLEMGARLKTRRGDNLYKFWGDRITRALRADLEGHEQPVVVCLASKEYFSAVRPKKLGARVITPQFKERRDGTLKMISFLAKKARGMMARYMVERRVSDPEQLKGFDTDGYRYEPELSTDDTWVFARG